MIRSLHLGMDATAGGLNRYVDELSNALRTELPVLADADAPLLSRLRRYRSAALATARDANVVDAHFALYALPVLRRLARLPLVVHFHGPWADESYASGEGRLKVAAKRAVERWVLRRARAVVVLSSAFRTVVIERYGVPASRVHVIPPGVDLERFSPGDRDAARQALGLPADSWVCVCARRLVRRTGVDVLLDAWAAVVDERPHAVLLVVGDGPERGALEACAPNSVRFLGGVNDERLVDCYRAADVSVVPSRALEGFGLVVLESLACGTPVVATDVGGLSEALAAFDESLLVPPEDAGALARRVLAALPGRTEAREHAEHHSWGAVAHSHAELYASVAKPRVVYVDHCAQLSGAELALSRLLPAVDVEAHVILGEDGPLVERLRNAGISVEVLPLASRNVGRERASLVSAAGLRSIAYAFRLARRLRQLRPDLVHTNSLKAALYGGLAGRLAGVPVVWHLHDRIAPDYLPRRAIRIVRAAARILPSVVVANSKATLATLPGIQGRVVPNAVAQSDTAKVNGSFVVGLVGRIAPWKGQHLFLEAFARAFPDGDERAAIVGGPLFGADEEAYADDLRRLAADFGLGQRVEFTGFRERIDDELAGMDILVHASVLPEPFGQVILEGMAAGLPVVVADAGGPAEFVDDDSTGLLYTPGDAVALAAALRRLAGDAALRDRLGQAARKRSRDFSPDNVATAMLNVYRSAL